MIYRSVLAHVLLTIPLCVTGVSLEAGEKGQSEFVQSKAEAPSSKIHFKRSELDKKFRSEGVAAGDFNHDSKLDIAAGSVWFAAPDWKMRQFREKAEEFQPDHSERKLPNGKIEKISGYSDTFCNYVDDLNGDGWDDLIVVDFPGKETRWFENPKNKPGPWKKHLIAAVTSNESPTYRDIDGDGKRELVFGTVPPGKDDRDHGRFVAYAKPNPADPNKPWIVHPISAPGSNMAERFSHGLGIGDVNTDGRMDIVTPQGWWQQPAKLEGNKPWVVHPQEPKPGTIGDLCSQMYVYDFNKDGRPDVLSTSAHQIGIWWHEQMPDGTFKKHDIPTRFSQTHATELADINGDGKPDFVTGKRYWAHGRRGDYDPGAPPVVFWYELTNKPDGTPVWIPHEIDNNSGVGTQFQVVDMNGDGLLDVITANKHGVYYFEQTRDQ